MGSNVKHPTTKIGNLAFFTALEQELAACGSVRFRVKGISMRPMLRNNLDEVQLVPCVDESLSPGDICLFKFQGRHILHRFIRKEGELYYFRGDNVLKNYEYCSREQIIGVVKVVYRNGHALSPTTNGWNFRIKVNRFKLQIRFAVSSCLPKQLKDVLKKVLGIRR